MTMPQRPAITRTTNNAPASDPDFWLSDIERFPKMGMPRDAIIDPWNVDPDLIRQFEI
jgi:hypothetical protein